MPLPILRASGGVIIITAKTLKLSYVIDPNLKEVYYDVLAECIRRDGNTRAITHLHSVTIGPAWEWHPNRIIFVRFARTKSTA